MKHILIIFLGLFLFCSTNSYGQFWKKKNGSASASSSTYDAPNNKDSFRGKNKKGPNVKSPGSPKSKSKSKLYQQSTSKKNIKLKNNSEFSSSKRRYKSATAKPKNSDKNGSQTSSGGRKSGKGRKKEK
ncbi:MAG: hypothetical protein HYU68_12730 [Bacteroidetes bacterium]|nr:hypothetical protein [Bacteroidota bacterium]